MCETGNMTKMLRAMATMPDRVIEYIATMESPLGLFSNSYDGTYKIKALTETEKGARKTFYVRFKINKDANGNISSFRMHECPSSGSQEFYLGYDMSGSSVTAAMVASFGSGAQLFRATATGAIDSSGSWTNKSIDFKGKFAEQNGTFSMYLKLVEWSNLLDLEGWFSGSNFNGKMRAFMQPIGFSTPSTAALGDGSGKMSSTYNNTTYSQTLSWNGDTRTDLSDVTAGDFYSQVNAATLPTIETYANSLFAFDSTKEEDWDCSDKASGEAHDLDVATTKAELDKVDAKYGEMTEENWVDCSSTWQ